MTKPEQTSFIDPSYKRTQQGHCKIDGVQFHSYHTGILRYADISDDGKIMVWTINAHRDGAATYNASVIGHGTIKGRGGSNRRFRSREAACRAGVKVQKEMKA